MNGLNRIFVAAALVMVASPAMASKARVNSLQGALGVVDTQTVFAQPGYMHKLNKYLTYEFGATTVTGNPKAEGGFMMEKNGRRWGAYLGHLSAYQNTFRGLDGFQRQDNPVDLFYGQDNWGANVSLSNSDDETTGAKQTTLIGRFGLVRDVDEFAATVELIANAEKTGGVKYTGAPVLEATYLRKMDEFTFQGLVAYGQGKTNGGTGDVDLKYTGLEASIMHRPVADIYYGAGATYGSLDRAGKKLETTAVPVFVGLEKDMFSWMTVRGSVKQNMLLGQTKNEIAGTNAQRNVNNTTVAMGLGFKQSGFTFDGTMSAGTSGDINAANFLTTASMTYNF